MKIGSVILTLIAVVSIISVAGIALNPDDSRHENKIRVAYFPNIGHAIPAIGMEKGIFQNELGPDTKIEYLLFDSGPQVIESLFSDSVDIAYVGPGPAINGFLKSENHNIRILSGAASGGASFVVHPNSEINTAADFVGKRIAAPPIGNTQDVSLRNYLSENGLKPAEKGGSVVVLNVSNPDIFTLFTKGEIDGAWVPEPWASALVQELGGHRLFHEEELWPDKRFASVVLIANTDYVNAHPLVIEKWLQSHQDTIDWINENPKESRIVFNEFMKNHMGKTLSDSILDESMSNLEITSDPIPNSIVTFAQRADSLGYLGRDGYDLEGIFLDINSNSQTQEVLAFND